MIDILLQRALFSRAELEPDPPIEGDCLRFGGSSKEAPRVIEFRTDEILDG